MAEDVNKSRPRGRLNLYWWFVCHFFTVRAKCASAIDKCKHITGLWTHTAEYGLSTHSQLQTPRFWTRVCRFAYVFTNLSSHLQVANAQESSSPVSAFVCRNLRDPQPSSLGRMRPCNTRPPQTATPALGPTHCQPQVFAVTRTQSWTQILAHSPFRDLRPRPLLIRPYRPHPPVQTATRFSPLSPLPVHIQTPPVLLPAWILSHLNPSSPPGWRCVWSTLLTPPSRGFAVTQQCMMGQTGVTCLDWKAWSRSWRAFEMTTCCS